MKEYKYFMMVPNMLDEMGLSPRALRLYLHLKRLCGEQKRAAREGTRRLALACGMSTGSVAAAKQELLARGLIDVAEVACSRGILHHIKLRDIWGENITWHSRGRPQPVPPAPAPASDDPQAEEKEVPVRARYLSRIWELVLKDMQLKLTKSTFHSLLQSSRLEELAEGRAVVRLVAPHAQAWLEHHHKRKLLDLLAEFAAPEPVTAIAFVVQARDPPPAA